MNTYTHPIYGSSAVLCYFGLKENVQISDNSTNPSSHIQNIISNIKTSINSTSCTNLNNEHSTDNCISNAIDHPFHCSNFTVHLKPDRESVETRCNIFDYAHIIISTIMFSIIYFASNHHCQYKQRIQCFFVIIILILCQTVYCQDIVFDCNGQSSCNGYTLDCSKNETDCYINCVGWRACQLTNIYCPDGPYDCYINCDGNSDACRWSNINGGGGNLMVYSGQWTGVDGTTINCPSNAYCNITCDDTYSCQNMNVTSKTGTVLNINVTGQYGAAGALEGASIHCPLDTVFGSNEGLCNIYVDSQRGNVLHGMKIYAVESFSDVNIDCIVRPRAYIEKQCLIDETGFRPTIFCTQDFSQSCEFQLANGNSSSWKCVDSDNICNNYILPTQSPTKSPTTAMPTISPTIYNPLEPPVTLHVDNTGCDWGLCDDANANYHEFYCSVDEFYNNYPHQYDFCGCKSNLTLNKPITTQQTFIPSECFEAEHGIITVDRDGIFTNKIWTYIRFDKVTKSVCFIIDPDYLCFDPTITVRYENIDYDKFLPTKFLDVSYPNKTNSLLDVDKCWNGNPSCDNFKDCPIATQPYEFESRPWTGLKTIYVTKGYGVVPLCANPTRSMNVEVSLTCHSFSEPKSTCQTMDYAWNCLNGIDLYPNTTFFNQTESCSEIYDGFGEIKIYQGTYFFDHAINIESQQIMISGEGAQISTLNHTVAFDVDIIKCEFVHCYVTIRNLKYVTSNPIYHIQAMNGGNIKFENVILDFETIQYVYFEFFSSNVIPSRVQFIGCTVININDGLFNISFTNVIFKNCVFKNNHIRFIMSNSKASFINVEFINTNGNSLTPLILAIDDTTLNIQDSIFGYNKNFTSLIKNDGSNVTVENSIFEHNDDIEYIFLSIEASSYSKILSSKLHPNNICDKYWCVTILNGDLIIDEFSASPFIPTSSPTFSPTIAPTNSPTRSPISVPTSNPSYPTISPTTRTPTQSPIYSGVLHCGDTVNGSTFLSFESVYYRFIIDAHYLHTVIFQTCGSEYDTMLFFRDTNMDIISSCDDCGNCGLNEQLAVSSLFNGTYILQLRGLGSYGRYNLYVNCSMNQNVTYSVSPTPYPTDSTQSPTKYNVRTNKTLVCGDSFTDVIPEINKWDTYYHKIIVPYLETMIIDACATNFEHYLSFRDEEFKYKKSWYFEYPCTPRVISDLSNGTYYIAIEGEAGIDWGEYTISIFCPTSNDTNTSQPTIFIPTTIAPTEYHTNITEILQFGHTSNDTNINTLYLYNFEPEQLINKVNFVYFGTENGSVVFEECNLFDSEFVDSFLFDSLSNLLSLTPTNIYNENELFLKTNLVCDELLNCYIECKDKSLVCFGSKITANSLDTTFIDCNSNFACLDTTMELTSSNQAVIKCKSDSSCKESVINVDGVNNFVLECIDTQSCMQMILNIHDNTTVPTIKCYAINACQSITINSDTNNIKLFIYSYNSDITVNVPSQYIAENIQCNPSNGYLSLNGDTFISLQKSARELLGSGMACENVKFSFTDESVVDCEIRYTFYNNTEIEQKLNYLRDFIQCFPPIYINDISEYDCFGTDAPTPAPSNSPIFDPTTSPTFDPTIDPTFSPSSSPSQPPTIAPTNSPTQSPTNYPTQYDDYIKWIDIEYQIKYLLIEDLQHIIDNTFVMINKIKQFMETSYVQTASTFSAKLQYKSFDIVIEKLNEYKIDINKQKKDSSLTLINLQSKQNKEQDFPHLLLTATINIDSDQTGSTIIVSSGNQNEFAQRIQNLLRQYFNNYDILFIVNPLNKALTISNPNIKTQDADDYVFYSLVIFLCIMVLLSLIALIYNKIPKSYVDDAKWITIIIFAIQCWDFISDWNLAFEIIEEITNGFSVLLLISGIGAITFVIVPYIANILIAANIKKLIKTNEAAQSYFKQNTPLFIALCVFSGGTYATLSLLSSRVFGLTMFNSGLTQYELSRLGKIKIFGTILLENLPQILFQLLYVSALGHSPTQNTILAFSASLLSIISSILAYYIDTSADDAI
eukprot:224851_1